MQMNRKERDTNVFRNMGDCADLGGSIRLAEIMQAIPQTRKAELQPRGGIQEEISP